MKKITHALILAGLLGAASAQAAVNVVEFDASKALTNTNWTDNTLSFGLFNSNLGTLNSITFELTGNISGIGKAESLDNSASDIDLSLSSKLTLSRPAGGSTLVITTPVFSTTYTNVASYDGITDYAGASGVSTGLVTATSTDSFTSTNSADFALFSAAGGGAISLGLKASGTSNGSGSGNLATLFSTQAGANVKVIYNYTEVATSVPEPETYGMMLLGLGVIGAVARRRAAKKSA